MPTDADLARLHTRQAWWLKVLRETDPRRPPLATVAEAAGLKAGSGSVVSLWENGKAHPDYAQLVRLAAFYGVPLSTLTEPKETDEERVAALRQLALGAAAVAELLSAEEAVAARPETAASRGAGPRRRSA